MYSLLLQSIVQLNFTPLCIILFLTAFLKINNSYERSLTIKFTPILIMLCMLVIDDNLDYWFFDSSNEGFYHVLTAVLGYNLRLMIIMSLVHIVLKANSIVMKIAIALPEVVTFVVTSLAFMDEDLVFRYEGTTTIRGPLAYVPHAMFIVYVLILLAYSIYLFMINKKEESAVIILEVLLSVGGTLVEMLFSLRGVLMNVIALNVTFYYLYLHTEHFKYDVLTGAFNREKYNSDVNEYGDRITNVVSIDMNDLKVFNDNFGHAFGDQALKIVVRDLQKCLPTSCLVYRVGGDEFMVLCTKTRKSLDLDKLMEKTANVIAQKNIGVAYGIARVSGDIVSSVKIADKRMYAMKVEMKKSTGTLVR